MNELKCPNCGVALTLSEEQVLNLVPQTAVPVETAPVEAPAPEVAQ